MKNAEIVQLWV